MSAQILLVTALDDTHRKPLLESEGYVVHTIRAEQARNVLNAGNYQLVLLVKETDSPEETIFLCAQLKQDIPGLMIGVIAQRAEYLPPTPFIDAVIRQQHSPRMFLNAVRKLLNNAGGEKSRSAAEGK